MDIQTTTARDTSAASDRANGGSRMHDAPTARASFDEFVMVRSSMLLRTAYLLTQDRYLAEDLVQTALAKAWRSWERIEGEPEPYVRRILVNTFSSWWRRKWNGETPSDELPEPGEHRDGDAADSVELRTALARLPKRQRAVIVLRFYEDLTEAETAHYSTAASARSRARPAKRSPNSGSTRVW